MPRLKEEVGVEYRRGVYIPREWEVDVLGIREDEEFSRQLKRKPKIGTTRKRRATLSRPMVMDLERIEDEIRCPVTELVASSTAPEETMLAEE